VHMEKDLLWERDAPIHRLTGPGGGPGRVASG
jgi:hypothetical protein